MEAWTSTHGFTIRSLDAYGNRQPVGGDEWHVEVLPFDVWDAVEPHGTYSSSVTGRLSRDCYLCSSATGQVQDVGDGSYQASVHLTRAGSYKLISHLLALPLGVAATYYAILSSEIDRPLFGRTQQRLDSSLDFVSPCPLRNFTGLLPGQVPISLSRQMLTHPLLCSGWVSSAALGGSWHSLLVDNTTWTDAVVSSLRTNISGWMVMVTQGQCQGQWRNLSDASSSASDSPTSLLNLTVSLPWSSYDGQDTAGPFGHTPVNQGRWKGCLQPDSSTHFILIPRFRAPGSLGDSAFATRWAGFLRTTADQPRNTSSANACLHSFQVLLSSSPSNQERVKMWLDNSLLIDQWSSLGSDQIDATASLRPYSSYRIQVLYKRCSSAAGAYAPRMMLRYSSPSSSDASAACGKTASLSPIPSQNLWAGERTRQGDEEAMIEVKAGATASASCISFGSGLTEGTAGVTSSFTVRARDAIGNKRAVNEDDWVVRLNFALGSDIEVPGHVTRDMDLRGDYRVTYSATVAGNYLLSVHRALPGGLTANVYMNAHLVGESDVIVSPQIDFNWGTAPLSDEQEAVARNELVSVKWHGWFKAELSETYTFTAQAPFRDSLRLHVGGRQLGSHWPMVSGAGIHENTILNRSDEVKSNAVVSGTVACTRGQLYEVSLDYRHEEGRSAVKLLYSASSVALTVVPSARLFFAEEHIFGSPFALYISPAETDAQLSQVRGEGMSLRTAGVASKFTILAIDSFGNSRSAWSDTWMVYSAPSRSSPLLVSPADFSAKNSDTATVSTCEASSPSADRNIAAVVSPTSIKGQYKFHMLQTRSGTSMLSVGLAAPGGLTATYYDTSLLSPHLKQTHIDPDSGTQTWKPIANRETGLIAMTVTSDSFSVRWAGAVRPTLTSQYTFFSSSIAAREDRVRLWIDGVLLIDQWKSLSYNMGEQPSVTTAFARAHSLYEIVLDYQSSVTTARSALHVAHSAGSPSLLPSSALFRIRSITPTPVTVKAAPTDFQMSKLVGEAVSCATAGIASKFTVICSDRYGNARGPELCNNDLEIRLRGSELSSSAKQLVFESAQPQQFDDWGQPLTYILTRSGAYEMEIAMGSAFKKSTVYVDPGQACAAAVRLQGQGLSVATAGFAATFTIQSRDAFGNPRTLNDDAFRVLVQGLDSKDRHDCRSTSLALPPASNLGRYTSSFRTTRSGLFLMHVRLVTEGKGKMNMTCVADVLHESGSSVSHVADLHAHQNSEPFSSTCGALNIARWEGGVSSRFSETYTFQTELGSAGERVRLWLEDRWVIDEWTSLSSLNPSGTLWMSKDTLVDLGLAYRQQPWSYAKGSPGVALRWGSASEARSALATDRLFSLGTHVQGSPFHVSVFPARTCGSVSFATGQGVSLATAGVTGRMTIVAKDHLGNLRLDAPYSSASGAPEPAYAVFVRRNRDYTVRDRAGTVSALGNGRYQVNYVPTWKRNILSFQHAEAASGLTAIAGAASYGEEAAVPVSPLQQVSILLAEQGGVHATYYSADNFSQPSRAGLATQISMTVLGSAPMLSGCVSSSGGFSARFRGMLRPPGQQRYTLTAGKQTLLSSHTRVHMGATGITSCVTSCVIPCLRGPHDCKLQML
jgi:hypothetical protein